MHNLLSNIPALIVGFILGGVAMFWFIVGVLEFVKATQKRAERDI